MTDRRNSITPYVDWIAISIYLVIVIMGWLNIYSAVYNPAHPHILDFSERYGKQFIWIMTGFMMAFFVMLSDASFFSFFAYPLYAITVLADLAVRFVGRNIAGSHSWFRIGEIGIQPAELGIFAINLGLAKYLSSDKNASNIKRTRLVAIAMIVVPMLFIIIQNETGVAVTYPALIFVLYREGLSGNILLFGFMLITLFILALVGNKIIISAVLGGIALLAFLIFTKHKLKDFTRVGGILALSLAIVFGTNYAFNHLEPHQKKRIQVFLQQNVNNSKEGYNLHQAEIGIASGSLFGKGYLQGTQAKLNYVPAHAPDFIFVTPCEEWGFFGATGIVLLYFALILRLIFLAERQRSPFSRIYGYGVASIFFIHVAINVGMNLGLVPVIGIPLPFISYGGSSFWAFTLLLFIFLRLDADRLQILR
jgi:rod shape determining protein RodA